MSAQKKLLECHKCTAAGFPGVQFYFDGKDANGWIMKNPDGSTHTHKVKVISQTEAPKDEYSELIAAIRELAAAIRGKL
jgi:hypothetical protein